MQLLCDENVYQKTVDRLRRSGMKVETGQRLNLRQIPDEDILGYAIKNRWTIVSRDKDFINLALFSEHSHYGVIILRIKPGEENIINGILVEVLQKYSSLKDKVVVINIAGYKIERRLGKLV